MECNKDEAVRAKDIAEKKYISMDFEGAKRFALKAQALFPALEGIAQMVTTFSIYLSSMVTISGEKNWYSILSVPMSVDDKTLKEQYRKLVFQVHPDKNSLVGAADAFKLVQEAWKVLSDKETRVLYDRKILQHQASQPRKTTASPGATSRGSYNFTANAAASSSGLSKKMAGGDSSTRQVRSQSTPLQRSAPPAVKSSRKADENLTFWTGCKNCFLMYEFYKRYMNLSLVCPECDLPFLATEIQIAAEHVNVGADLNIGAKSQKRRANTSDHTVVGKKMRTTKYAAAGTSSSTSCLQSSHSSRHKISSLFEENHVRAILLEKSKVAVREKLDEIKKMKGNGAPDDSTAHKYVHVA